MPPAPRLMLYLMAATLLSCTGSDQVDTPDSGAPRMDSAVDLPGPTPDMIPEDHTTEPDLPLPTDAATIDTADTTDTTDIDTADIPPDNVMDVAAPLPFQLVDATQNLPTIIVEARHAAAGDLDGDGDLDIVLAVGSGQNLLLTNDGEGHFLSAPLSTVDQETSCIVPFHLDGDGDLDLFIGNVNQPSVVVLGDGQGGFTEAGEALAQVFSWQVERVLPGDLDGDGDTDLVVLCSGSQQERLLRNDGGVLVDATTEQLPSDDFMAAQGSLGSVDGEGPPDLVFASFISSQTTRLWRNDGQGTFSDESNLLGTAWESMGFDAVLADLDGDDDLDLFEASTMAPQRVLLNDGLGGFTNLAQAIPPTAGPFGNGTFLAVDAAIGDLDLDGLNDVLLGCSGHTAGANDEVLLLGTGGGKLTPMSPSPFAGHGGDTRHVLLFDMDGDGDLDVFVANAFEQSRLYLNQ